MPKIEIAFVGIVKSDSSGGDVLGERLVKSVKKASIPGSQDALAGKESFVGIYIKSNAPDIAAESVTFRLL